LTLRLPEHTPFRAHPVTGQSPRHTNAPLLLAEATYDGVPEVEDMTDDHDAVVVLVAKHA
jgi:NAD/NADP transhydrogenase beta subunit